MKNYISLQGRLGRNPELTEKQSQKGPFKVTTFSIAVDRDFGDETDWFFCEVTGKQAEILEKFFHKGDMIVLDGRMESYKPKRDPEHKSWKVTVTKFWFVDRKKNGEQVDDGPAPDGFEDINEDVPF